MKNQMNEAELLKQFFENYQSLSMGDLVAKYETNEYWEIINSKKLFQYLKDNNLFEILIHKDPSTYLYTGLTRKGDKYQVELDGYTQDFDSLESAAKFKLEYLVKYMHSSLTWKS